MSATAPDAYFRELGAFPHRELFKGAERVWEAVALLGGFLRALADAADAPSPDVPALRVEEGLAVSEGLLVPKERLKVPSLGLLIEAGARVEPGVVIKGPALLCGGAELRHGAYLRENCLIGPGAVVGHATEVKNSALLNGAEAGHFAYVGDSLLGARANLGAGVKLANLRFRTEEEKRAGAARSVRVRAEGEELDTGLGKFGAVVGDDAELGCNAVTSPGALLGPGCWVAPGAVVARGVWPAKSFFRGARPRVAPRPL